MKSKVATEALRKELTTLQSKLEEANKALAPPAKAKPLFTFFPFPNPPYSSQQVPPTPHPVTDIHLPINSDGTVHVRFSILNPTTVNADAVTINLVIPEAYRFAKDPLPFSKQPGDRDTERSVVTPQILALGFSGVMEADVVVPSTDPFRMGITYRCRNCEIVKEGSLGTVHLVRP